MLHWPIDNERPAFALTTRSELDRPQVAEVLHRAADAVVQLNLRAPTQNTFAQADVEAGPLQIAEAIRMKLRVVGSPDGRGHRRMQLAIRGFHSGADVETVSAARVSGCLDEGIH